LRRSVSDRHRSGGADALANTNYNSAHRTVGVPDAKRNAAERTDTDANRDTALGTERDANSNADALTDPW
jgi:hypothetical protein